MSVQVLNLKLQRTEPGVSWGFVIQGGKEFHSPFVVQKVHPNSLADQASMRQGDYILRIGNRVVENFTHSQARETISAQGNHLELTIQRGAAPRSEDYNFNFAFPQHRLMNQENMSGVPSSSPQVGIQLNNNKALLTQSYNSPMGLYSNQNIAETLVTTMKNPYGMRKSRSDSSSSLSSSSYLSNSLSPTRSFGNKPPLPAKPRPFRRAETVEPIRLESATIIENKENSVYKAIPVDPKLVCQEPPNKRHSLSSGLALLKKIEATEAVERPLLDENRNEIKINVNHIKDNSPVVRRPSWTPTKQEIVKQVSKLNNPNCPSMTQSKSFRLLQEALEKGDKEKDLVYYDKITNKTEVRRFSLNDNLANLPIRRLSKAKTIDHECIEENTDQYQPRANRAQSVTREILSQGSLLTNLKPTSSKDFNQRRHSYIMNINDQTYLQEAQKVRKNPTKEPVPKPLISTNKHIFSPSSPVTQYKPYQTASKPASAIKPYQANNYNQPGFKPSGNRGPSAVNRGLKGSAIFNNQNHGPNQPQCASCFQIIRGPFISAVGKIWCPNHFVCANQSCAMSLIEVGFVEENGKLYCEHDYANFFAPKCNKCHSTILAECCYALDKTYHPECFVCVHCKQIIGSGKFHIEDGMVYCERDYIGLFSVKCAGCEFPIEAGDKFLEAVNDKWHVECFICSKCNVPLSGGFAVKGNKPYCKKHAY